MRFLILAAALTTLFHPTDSPAEIQLASVLEAGGSSAVAVHGNYILGGLGSFLLSIDASDPSNPVRVGSLELSSYVYDIIVSGSVAYVGTDDNLSIFDISNPAAPVLLGTESSEGAVNLSLSGSLVFATFGSNGLRSIDVSDPTNPIKLGSTSVSHWPWGIRVVGSYAFTTSFTHGGLTVIDVSNPSAPTELISLNVLASGWDLEIVGQYAYLPHSYGLSIVDLTIPTNPVPIGNYSGSYEEGMCVSVVGNHAYVFGMYGNLDVVDVSVPNHPVLAHYEPYMGGPDVDRVGNRLYVADDYSSFDVIDISNPVNPTRVGSCHSLSSPLSVAIQDDVLYVGEGGRITTMNVQHTSSPQWLGEFENYYWPNTVVVPMGTTLFVGREASIFDGGDGGLSIFDVTQPASPVELSTKWGFDAVYDMHTDGTYAYLLGATNAGQTQLVTYDVTNQAMPIQLSSGGVPFFSPNLDVTGNLALVACQSSDLRIYDVANHNQPPALVSTFTGTTDARDVVAVGSIAFVADAAAGLIAVDISSSINPTEVGRLAGLGQPLRIVVKYPYVVMTGSDPLLRIIDVSDPSAPIVVDAYQAGAAYDIAVEGSTIALVGGYQGPVVLLDAPILNSPTSVSRTSFHATLNVYPNPFNPQTSIAFTIPTRAIVTVDIFDAAGRRLRSLVDESLEAGQHRADWDGRDAAGLACASGVYFCRLRAGNEVMSQKLVLLK